MEANVLILLQDTETPSVVECTIACPAVRDSIDTDSGPQF